MASDVCPVYLSSMLNNRIRKLIHDPKKILSEYVHKGDTVADIGCGPGFFSIALADMVGEQGHVIAVDLQRGMLDKVKSESERLNIQSRITPHQCREDRLDIKEKVDFVLAFWMVHEVPNARNMFDEIVSILKPGGRFMLVEPKLHTFASTFQSEIDQACSAGLRPDKKLDINISRGMLFSLP